MRLSGHLVNIFINSKLRQTFAGGWLKRWLHWGGQGAAVDLTTSFHTKSPIVGMHEETNYELQLAVLDASIYCIEQSQRGVDARLRCL